MSAGFHTRAQVLVGASLGKKNKLEKMNGVYAACTQVFAACTQVYAACTQVFAACTQVFAACTQVFVACTQVFAACIQSVCTQKSGLNKCHKIVQNT